MNRILKKQYDSIWKVDRNSFGPPSPDMLSYCRDFQNSRRDLDIIDIGSGNGRYALAFAQDGYRTVTALDISKAGCKQVRKRINRTNPIIVLNKDIMDVGVERNHDIVFSSGLLEEIDNEADQVAAVEKMKSLAKVNGLIVMRYCLFISNRDPEERVPSNLVRPLFSIDAWSIIDFKTDPEPFYNQKSTIHDGQNTIKRQTLVAKKLG